MAALVAGGQCICSVAAAQPPGLERSPANSADEVDGRYIVVYDDMDRRVRAETAAREAKLGFESTRRYSSALEGFAAQLTPTQRRKLKQDPEVAFVGRDRRVEIAGYAPLAPGEPTPPTGVRRILGAVDGTVREASGINVAVIDTGVQLDHPDLNVVDGIDCVDPGTPASDENGHGTHVTGTIAAKNDGAGVVGVAPGTRVYAVRVLGASGSGTTSGVICGIDWVTANATDLNIRVVNMSLSGFGPPLEPCQSTTDPEHIAICNSTAAGVNYVVAAANDGWDFDLSDPPIVPAAYPEVLTTTAFADVDGAPGSTGASEACNAADDRAIWFSNFAATNAGRAHTVAAPGVCIRSTWIGSGYETISGTSMAAPHAAGALALCINDGGTEGACARLTPAEAIAEMHGRAESQSATYPSYGFLRDPQHLPYLFAYYGFPTVVPEAPAPPPAAEPPPPAPNDAFDDAQDLGDHAVLFVDGSNFPATKEPAEPSPGVSQVGGASVWYRWTAPRSARYSIRLFLCDVEGGIGRATLGVYGGPSVGELTRVAGTEFPCHFGGELLFDAAEGVTYHIAVDGWGRYNARRAPLGVPAEGTFRVSLELREGAPTPPQTPPSPPTPPLPPNESNHFTFGQVIRNMRKGTARLEVAVPRRGDVELAGNRKIRGQKRSAKADTVRLPIKPKLRARRRLERKGEVRIAAEVTYTPEGGEPKTKTKKVRLRKR